MGIFATMLPAKVYLVVRIEFDNLENRVDGARSSEIVGWAPDEEQAKAFVDRQPHGAYLGWDGEGYPQWRIAPVDKIP